MASIPTARHDLPSDPDPGAERDGAVRLEHLLALPGAMLAGPAPDAPAAFTGVRTDTRTLAPGELFVAVVGSARDGHDFADQAVAAGAGGLLVSRDVPAASEVRSPDAGEVRGAAGAPGAAGRAGAVPVVRVPDTLAALQQLAAAHRQRSTARVVAVTGSVGKTTTKAMLAGVLRARHDTHANEASYNNHLGVPLTLLGIRERHSHVVAEVGTNHRGEIDALGRLVDPDVAVLTTIGYAHVGNFASRDELAEEKTDLLRRVRPGGLWLLNGDDPLVAATSARIDRPDVAAVRVGFGPGNDLRAVDVRVTEQTTTATVLAAGETPVPLRLPVAGRHLLYGALLALAAGREHGINLATGVEALGRTALPAGRVRLDRLDDGLLVVDDSYNAAPDAMLSALDLLGQLPGASRIAVLGEMGELGELSEELHRVVGTRAAANATHLVTVGPATAGLVEAAVAAGLDPAAATTVGSAREALAATRELLATAPGPAVVLAKGSRFRHMERVQLGLSGRTVGCPLQRCTLYISCADCPKLATG